MTRINAQIDVRHVLPSVRVPTVAIHRGGDECLRVEEGRYFASLIPGARFVELPGRDHLPFVGDQDSILKEIERFLTGFRHDSELDRVLATILVVHGRGADASRWAEYRLRAAREIEWFGGRTLPPVRETVQAIFDGPARAIRCAYALLDQAVRSE